MKRLLVPLLGVILFLSFFRLGAVSLFDVDEAVFATATREMVESGDWITPTYNGVSRYDKPALFYWYMALFYKAFGVSEFSARVPSALSAFLLGAALFFFLRRFQGVDRALFGTFPFVLSVYFLVYSHAAVTDMTLTLFISLALFCFYGMTDEKEGASSMAYGLGFYGFAALAFLTKGLIGILFPFSVALVFLAVTQGLAATRKVFRLEGIALFLVLSVPWYAAQLAINGREFIDQFIVKHHFVRYTGVISGHKGPFWYYLPVLMAGMFPWVAFLPAGLREVLKSKERLLIFASVWAGLIFCFFSVSTTKLPNYILPAIPAFSILIGTGLSTEGRWNRAGYAFLAVLSAAIAAAFVIARGQLYKVGIQETVWVYPGALILGLLCTVAIVSFAMRKESRLLVALITGVFVLYLAYEALPTANRYMQGTLRAYSEYAGKRLLPDEKLLVYKINFPSIVFYSGRRIVFAGDPASLSGLQARLAIAKAKDRDVLEAAGFRVMQEDGRYALLERP